MLTGNRKLAAVIAGLLAMVGTTALVIIGAPENVALTALGLEAGLAGGGAIFTKDTGS